VLTNPVFGGAARAVGVLCNDDYAYAISSLNGNFPSPLRHTHSKNWDLFVFAHELGHVLGSRHSFQYVPPIECNDGSGPDAGTLMSYCHQAPGGVANVGMRFHLREQTELLADLALTSCPQQITLARGDYDLDGDRDLVDLAAADGVLAQGFRSLASEQVFDMDADGDFDLGDRTGLAAPASGAPPASARFRNGSGVNPTCYSSLTNPVLGRTWSSQVAAPAGGGTWIGAYDRPHAGVFNAWGELLVATSAHGGRALLQHFAPSAGGFARHDVPITLDASLLGLSVATQAVVIGPGGPRFCNAIDLVFSAYE
jgi:hypothetical protein